LIVERKPRRRLGVHVHLLSTTLKTRLAHRRSSRLSAMTICAEERVRPIFNDSNNAGETRALRNAAPTNNVVEDQTSSHTALLTGRPARAPARNLAQHRRSRPVHAVRNVFRANLWSYRLRSSAWTDGTPAANVAGGIRQIPAIHRTNFQPRLSLNAHHPNRHGNG
jgi:hypothetical protein